MRESSTRSESLHYTTINPHVWKAGIELGEGVKNITLNHYQHTKTKNRNVTHKSLSKEDTKLRQVPCWFKIEIIAGNGV